jgi:hypothetical protein
MVSNMENGFTVRRRPPPSRARCRQQTLKDLTKTLNALVDAIEGDP